VLGVCSACSVTDFSTVVSCSLYHLIGYDPSSHWIWSTTMSTLCCKNVPFIWAWLCLVFLIYLPILATQVHAVQCTVLLLKFCLSVCLSVIHVHCALSVYQNHVKEEPL